MAQIYALLGNADERFPFLNGGSRSRQQLQSHRRLLRIDPIWDPIRSDPRFQELVAEKNPHL